MQPEAPALIWDARRAAGRVLEFVAGRSWDDYQEDVMLRSAVERQFQIIGEALNRLSKVDAATAVQVPNLAVLRPEFQNLFSDEELEIAHDRLREYGLDV